ncbi:DNA polymerase III PolC-type [Fundidesulfovibrio magnetotacticus]|uniref:DNA polymerase III PolC-type n=1 Tax=Fundidesulfovibrio magnetotacticus TaxID=2730080 RepID=A0A6V8LN03_9BACT|nr:3'-5' exonuclease [Fundidesulfovibrio magnetotacticus]GFK93044.1 DNA polymerase III PolC-type [Fundidesulfovibrio magnetotacticus]
MMKWWPWSSREPDTPAGRAGFVVFDLETGGLDPSRDDILSIGAVRMTGGRIDVGGAFQALARPTATSLDAAGVRVHQLTPGELAGEPPLEEVLPRFLRYAGDAVLTGWHVELDLAFLRAACKRLKLPQPRNRGLDVLGLYLAIRGSRASPVLDELPLKDATLYSVARALGVPPRGAHDALGDAYLTAQVLQRFLSILRSSRQGEELSLDTVLRLAAPSSRSRASPQPAF